MRRIKKLKKLDSDPIHRNHMGLEHRIEVLTQNISHLVHSVAGLGTHLHRPHEERKAEHLLIPMDRAFNVGDADAYMVYTPRIGRTFGWISLCHSPDYSFMNWSVAADYQTAHVEAAMDAPPSPEESDVLIVTESLF